MRHAVLLAFASLILVTSGCKSQCRLLSEKLCDCTTNSSDKTLCLSNAARQEGTFPPTAAQDDQCGDLLGHRDYG